MVAIKRSPKALARIRERVRKNLCLAIDDEGNDCNRPQACNGNCTMHDQRARHQEAKLPTLSLRKAFHDELIRKGWRLSPQEVREFKTCDRFAQIANGDLAE